MNTYKISGADRTTGEERTVVLEAADEKSAATKASQEHNLMVSKMRLMPPPKVTVPPPAREVAPVAYAPLPPPRPFPSYAVLAGLIWALRIIGGIAIAMAVLFFGLIILGAAKAGGGNGGAMIVVIIPTVGGPLVAGLVLFAMGELLSCVRDMAINSFRQLQR